MSQLKEKKSLGIANGKKLKHGVPKTKKIPKIFSQSWNIILNPFEFFKTMFCVTQEIITQYLIHCTLS